jgi:hypothetical protein
MATIAYYIGEHRVLVDEEFLPLMQSRQWLVLPRGYVKSMQKGEDGEINNELLHRAILQPKREEVIDHKNGNPLDNRLKNLRVCTILENTRNMKKWAPKTKFQYKGVNLRKDGMLKPWVARIRHGGKKISLGCYYCEYGAAKAYDRAAKELFGEFANLNFPEPVQAEDESSFLVYQQKTREFKSELRGVGFVKRSKTSPWVSSIRLNGKNIYLGVFATEQDAARAYDNACWEFYKKPHKLNFPEEYENMM